LVNLKKAEHRVSRLCSVLGISRTGYYPLAQRPDQQA
jgi:hypothetical protein